MEILDACDLTGSLRDAAELAGCSHHTVKRYVEVCVRAGGPPDRPVRRSQLIDPFLGKVEEWVDRSKGRARADRVHAKLVWLGYMGSERTTRRAVAEAKTAWHAGRRRVHRPWVTEPGMWLQYDYGDGPVVDGVKTILFVAWLAWSRFRVVFPIRDKTLPSVFAALDVTFRRLGGGADLCVDRQREDGHRGAHRGDPGAEPATGRVRPSLCGDGPYLCPGRPRRARAAPKQRCGSRRPIWCRPRPTWPTSTGRSPRWNRPAASSVTGSTTGSIGSPGGCRWRCWPRNRPGCTRSTQGRSRSRSG